MKALSQLDCSTIYLRQEEIENILDGFYEAIWEIVEECDDARSPEQSHRCPANPIKVLKSEDIENQRGIYGSDRKADSVNLRRHLRECLRSNHLATQLSHLTKDEVSVLRSAVELVTESHRS